MLTAYEFNKAHDVIHEAKRIVANEMPNAMFILKGVDNDFVYFNIVCKLHETNADEIRDIRAKTRFIPRIHPDNETGNMIYKGEFKIQINL